jgi:hypothetical protein
MHWTRDGAFGSAALLVRSLCRRGSEKATVFPVIEVLYGYVVIVENVM